MFYISTHLYFAKNVEYFSFNSCLSFQWLRLLWGYHFHFVDSNHASNNSVISVPSWHVFLFWSPWHRQLPWCIGTLKYDGWVSNSLVTHTQAKKLLPLVGPQALPILYGHHHIQAISNACWYSYVPLNTNLWKHKTYVDGIMTPYLGSQDSTLWMSPDSLGWRQEGTNTENFPVTVHQY